MKYGKEPNGRYGGPVVIVGGDCGRPDHVSDSDGCESSYGENSG